MGGTSKENIIKEIRCKGTYSNVCLTQHYFILPFFNLQIQLPEEKVSKA